MRIDLIGVPGSGKSTLAHDLTRQLGGKLVNLDMRQSGPRQRLVARAAMVGAIVRRPAVTVAMIPAMAGPAPALRGALGLARREVLASRFTSGVMVVDEGPLHGLLWTAMIATRSPDVRRLGRRLSRPDVVVDVVTDVEVAAARARGSDRRLGGWSTGEMLEAAIRYRDAADQLKEVLGVPVIEVDGGSQVDSAALTTSVARMADSRRPGSGR